MIPLLNFLGTVAIVVVAVLGVAVAVGAAWDWLERFDPWRECD